MLNNPFTGKELFAFYQMRMFNNTQEEAEQSWEEDVGKTKKKTYNDMAKMINERMRGEPSYIKGEQS